MITGQDRVISMLSRVAAFSTLRKTMDVIATRMEAHVKMEKLSGQALKRRTGNLSRSITHKTSESNGTTTAIVGTNASYAAVHEFGHSGSVNVPAHMRMQTMAFGKRMAAKQVMVKAHPMKQNIPERSFLRSTLNETRTDSLERIRRSMRDLINE